MMKISNFIHMLSKMAEKVGDVPVVIKIQEPNEEEKKKFKDPNASLWTNNIAFIVPPIGPVCLCLLDNRAAHEWAEAVTKEGGQFEVVKIQSGGSN